MEIFVLSVCVFFGFISAARIFGVIQNPYIIANHGKIAWGFDTLTSLGFFIWSLILLN